MPYRELAELLHVETEHPPPTRIDIAQAMHDGRRLRQRRTLRPVLAAAAVLAVAAGTIAVVRVTGPAASGPPVASAPTATATATAAPASFDPLRVRLSIGWVPAGLQRRDPVTATGNQQLVWAEPVAPTKSPKRWVDVWIYAADITPWQVTTGYWKMVPAEPINGGQAAWLVLTPRTPDPLQCDVGCVDSNDKTQHDSVALAWRWAPNAWAVVKVLETDASTQQAIARRVAESVRTDGDDPVRLPFTVKRLPASLPLAMIEPYASPQYSVALRFGGGPDPVTQFSFHRENLVALTITWVPAGHTNKDTPNRTVDGSPAAVHFDSTDWGSVNLYRDGYEVSLWIPNREGRDLIDEQLAIAIVTSVKPVPDPTDRTQWSASPLQ